MRYFKSIIAALAFSFVAAVGTANAGVQTEVDSISSGFLWKYKVSITDVEVVTKNDFFTIYDFNGYISGTITAPNADWTATVQNFGNAGPNQSTSLDDPTIPNLVFKYIGAVTLDNAALSGLTFQASSIYGNKADGWSTSQTTKVGGGNRKNGSTDATEVPTAAVPLPAASWMGLGLLSALALGHLIRTRRAQA